MWCYKKFGCYWITDACAADVINQSETLFKLSIANVSTFSIYACDTLASHRCNKVWKKGPKRMFCHTCGRASSNSPSLSGGLGRCPRRHPTSSQPCSSLESRWKRLSSVSKTGQHLRILHLIWRRPQTYCAWRWYWCSTWCKPSYWVSRANVILLKTVAHSSDTDASNLEMLQDVAQAIWKRLRKCVTLV